MKQNVLHSMPGIKKNVLLQKDDVGKRKEGFHQLPGPDFTYGRSDNVNIQEGVGHLVNHWKMSQPSQAQKDKVVDFRKINKVAAVRRGITSTRVSYQIFVYVFKFF